MNAGWAYTWHHLSKKTGAKVIGPHNPVTRAKAVKSPPVVEDAPTPTPPVAVVEEAPPPPVVEDAPTPTPPWPPRGTASSLWGVCLWGPW